jgi:Nucleotidyltransferase domain
VECGGRNTIHDPIGVSHDEYVAERRQRDPEFAAAYDEACAAMELENDPLLSIPAEVCEVVNRYLDLIEVALPGRIEGLYLVGSTALGDYTPGQSDVDFVTVTGDLLTTEEREQLRSLHAGLLEVVPRPFLDGIYVTWEHLRQNPSMCEDVPFTLEGTFEPTGGFEANPSTWLTLAQYPLAVRGPAAPSVWHDRTAIRQWNLDNLNS